MLPSRGAKEVHPTRCTLLRALWSRCAMPELPTVGVCSAAPLFPNESCLRCDVKADAKHSPLRGHAFLDADRAKVAFTKYWNCSVGVFFS